MKKCFFCCLVLLGHLVYASTDSLYLANAEFPDSVEYAKIPLWQGNTQMLGPKMISDSDAYYVELNTPNVLDQGKQGSCAGFAFGYAAMGILTYDKYGNWNAAKRSPAYLYHRARIADGVNASGSSNASVQMTTAYNVACQYGCCSYDMMPYVVSDYNSVPTELQDCDAYMNRAEGYRLEPTTNIQIYKELLRSGCPIVVRIEITPTFDSIWRSGGIWNIQPTESSRGGHFMCIVGYNDSTQMLKAQNSWGGNGGDQGFVWISYDLVQQGIFTHAICLTNITDGHYLSIQGPSQFCDTASYTLTNVPAGATITWKNYNRINPTYPYYIKSGQGTSRVLYQRGKQDDGRLHRPNFVSPDYTGSAVVSATVSLNGHSYTVSKNVYIGTIAPQVLLYNAQGTMQVAPRVGASYRLLVNNCTDVADNQFHWVVSSSVQEFERLGQGRYFPLTIDEQQTVTAQVSYSTDECGTVTTTKTFSFTLPVTLSSASLVFRNPAGVGEDLEVGIVLPDENPSSTTYGLRPNTEIGAYTLELWSELYGRVRTVEADTPTTQMSLSGLNAGTYFLKLIINNEIVATQQLIIK